MHILGAGKGAFLEFLRNITPQIVLLAIVLVLSSKLNFNQWDLSNWGPTFAFFACLATFFLAIVANAINFFEQSIGSLPWLDARAAKAKRRIHGSKGRLMFLVRSLNRRKWSFAIDTIVSIVVLEVGVISASIMGIQTAISSLSGAQG